MSETTTPEGMGALKSWEPEPYTAELRADTNLPALAPELCRLMIELGKSNGFDLPLEVSCEVRVTFKSKVSRDDVHRLLDAAAAELWGLDARCYNAEED